jgi:hypothetical protein
MAGLNDQRNDTIDVHSPDPPAETPPSVHARETVRIQLPVRDASEVTSTQFFRPTNPTSIDSVPPDVAPLEPKTETARVSPAVIRSRAVAQEKNAFAPTQGIIPHAEFGSLTPAEKKNSNLLWWMLLGLSALILLIQIWTYLS